MVEERWVEFEVEIYNRKTKETHCYTKVLDVEINGMVLYVKLLDETFSHWVGDLEYLEYIKNGNKHFVKF